MASLDKQQLEAMRESLRKDHFSEYCRIRILEASDQGSVAEMVLGPEQVNSNGEIHGGAMYTLADMVCGVTAYTWGQERMGEGYSCTTTSSSFHFLRPVRGSSRLIGRSKLRKGGRSLIVIDVTIEDEKGTEICGGTMSFCLIDLARYSQSRENQEKQ